MRGKPPLSARSFACRLALVVVLVAFTAAGIARLGPSCLFEPDSADYLFTARALAQFDGVREIDHPARALHVFRPPGLPLLLAPLAWVRAYDVVAAKLLLLAVAGLALGLLWRYAEVVGAGSWGACGVVVLVAASPFALLHATEVVTEFPFLAAALGALLLVEARPERPPRTFVACASALLAAAALFRTVGLALIVALALWSLWRRQRGWLVAAVIAALPNLLWMWRCSRTAAPTYLGAIADAVERLGSAGYAASALSQGGWYLARLPALIFPGAYDAKPVYERVLLSAAPGPGFPAWILSLLAACVAAAAAYGMWVARARGGAMAALFTGAYLAALALYPPQHERLAWPLVPFVWSWAAVAAHGWATGRGMRRSAARTWGTIALTTATLLLLLLEGAGSVAMVRANQTRRADGASFYARTMPPGYYADWQGAGRFIREESPAHARVLTRHSDLGFASRRYQDSMRFEELSPRQWRGAIAALPARYLVLPDVRCGEGIRWQAFDFDPAYDYITRYAENGVVVLEVEPNRDGIVTLDSPRLKSEIDACRAAVLRLPQRSDLKRRLADLLGEAGRPAEGLALIAPLTGAPGARAEVWLTQGELLLDLERPEDAARAFELAARAPGAEWLENAISRGRRKAQNASTLSRLSAAERARILVQEGLDQLDALDLRAATLRIARAERLAPEAPEMLAARATLARRVGRRDESREIFAHLASLGDRAAQATLSELDREAAIDAGAAGTTPVDWLRVARFQAGDGAPGRALATLERAAGLYPRDRALLSGLAELYLFFGLPERARPIYRDLVAGDSGDAAAVQGLERCRELLRPADF